MVTVAEIAAAVVVVLRMVIEGGSKEELKEMLILKNATGKLS